MQPMPLELRFGSPQLILGWRVADQLIDQLDDLLLQLLRGDAVSSPRIAEAERVATNQTHGRRSGAFCLLGTTDQVLMEPRCLTVPEDAEGEVDCIEIRPSPCGYPPGEVDSVGRPLAGCLCAWIVRQRIKRPSARFGRLGTGWEMPEVAIGPLEGIIWLYIAHDRQDGIVRQVVAPEEGMGVLQRGCIQVLH